MRTWHPNVQQLGHRHHHVVQFLRVKGKKKRESDGSLLTYSEHGSTCNAVIQSSHTLAAAEDSVKVTETSLPLALSQWLDVETALPSSSSTGLLSGNAGNRKTSPFPSFWGGIKFNSHTRVGRLHQSAVRSAAATWDGRARDDGDDGRDRPLALLLFGLPQVGEALGLVGHAALGGRRRDDALGGVVVVALHPGKQKRVVEPRVTRGRRKMWLAKKKKKKK